MEPGSSGELQEPFREKGGTKPAPSRPLWRRAIVSCCHETVGHVYIHVLLVWPQKRIKNNHPVDLADPPPGERVDLKAHVSQRELKRPFM